MSDDVQEPKEHVGHVWYYRLRRDARPQQIEFPSKVNKTDASNLIAKQLGMDELPSEVAVSHVPLEKLDPLPVAQQAQEPEREAEKAAKKK